MMHLGRLAQLVRALSSHGRSHRFESCAAHFLFRLNDHVGVFLVRVQTAMDDSTIEARRRRQRRLRIVSIAIGLTVVGVSLLGVSAFYWWVTPRIDATNLETFQASYKVIRDSLPETDRGKLDGASSIVTMTNAHIYVPRRPTSFSKDGKKRSTDDISFMVKALHGMTGSQIIAEAEKISRERPDQWRRPK